MAFTRKIKLWDIFLLMISAIIAEIVVVLPLQAFNPSRFLTISLSVVVGSIWWIVGYQRLSRTRGWESLQERFSRVDGWIILVSALGGLFLILPPWGLGELAGMKIPDIPAQAVLPSNLLQVPLAIAGVVVLGPQWSPDTCRLQTHRCRIDSHTIKAVLQICSGCKLSDLGRQSSGAITAV